MLQWPAIVVQLRFFAEAVNITTARGTYGAVYFASLELSDRLSR